MGLFYNRRKAVHSVDGRSSQRFPAYKRALSTENLTVCTLIDLFGSSRFPVGVAKLRPTVLRYARCTGLVTAVLHDRRENVRCSPRNTRRPFQTRFLRK